MANRFNSPNQQFVDATGTPYAGGALSFFASGTSTPLNTFSNSGLTIANTNPIVLDSAGRAGSVFLQNLAYKVVLADANNNQIWTEDPVSTSDFTAVAQFNSGNGSPNGNQAGTAGSPGVPASVYWDDTNFILYVCTLTGTSSTAVWTAVNPSATQSYTPPPQGRLTLSSGSPIVGSDIIGTTAVFYTAYQGNSIPIWNGSTFSIQNFAADLTLTLVANHAGNTLYDVFAFVNGGVLTLVTGPAWSSSAAGSSARGSGAGTTQITRLNGILVNAVQFSGRNGSSTFTIAANQGTLLGTIHIDATAGQTTFHVNAGQNRKVGVSNAWQAVPTSLLVQDPSNWAYATNTIRASDNAPSSFTTAAFNVGSGTVANGANIVCSVAQSPIEALFTQRVDTTSAFSTGSSQAQIMIGWNSTTANSGQLANQFLVVTSGTLQNGGNLASQLVKPPAAGLNIAVCCENVPSAPSGGTSFSGATAMLMKVDFLA